MKASSKRKSRIRWARSDTAETKIVYGAIVAQNQEKVNG